MATRRLLTLFVVCLLCHLVTIPPLKVAGEDGDGRPTRLDSLVDYEAAFVARRDKRIGLLLAPSNPPDVAGSVSHAIDRFIRSAWIENSSFDGPRLCSDATFARRVYLDVIGVIPTVSELNEFLACTHPDKRQRLIDELLSRDVDYAAHFASWWEDALASNKSDTFGGVLTRGDHQAWIVDNLKKNEPFDLMVAELIDPRLPGYKQPKQIDILGIKYQIGFLRDRSHQEILQSAADVAQVFLGTSMKCASCHDHFENQEWPQRRFLGFAGFFSPHDLNVVRCEESQDEIVATQWPFPHDLAKTTQVSESYTERLALAAQLVTDPLNERFSQTIVNRLWKRFLGTGLYEPVDDYRSNVSASHPQLLAWLAEDLVRHRFDIKHTIRLILTSETYQQMYRSKLADRFDADNRSAPRFFRSPSLRRLTAEQLIDSVQVAATQQLEDERRAYRVFHGNPNDLAQVLGRAATRSEVSTFRSGETAIVQALELINGGTYDRLTHFCIQPPISRTTRLIDLDGAQQEGVRIGWVRVRADGVTQVINLADVMTLGDVMDRINEFLEQVKIPPHNHEPGQLLIRDDSFYLRVNPGHSVSIEEVEDGQTAGDLGIRLQATSSPITGARLNPKAVLDDSQSNEQQTILAQHLGQASVAEIAAHVYRVTLSRPASQEELLAAEEYLQQNGYASHDRITAPHSTEAVVDLFWVLLTSPMFQYVY